MSNIIKYNYIRIDSNDMKTVTSNYDGFFQTVGQVVPKENIVPSNNIQEEECTDIGALLTSPKSVSEAARLEQVLKEQEEFLNSRVDAVIAEANIKAGMIVEQANDNARHIYENSRKDGYDAGYEQGMKAASEEISEMRTHYDRLIHENEEVLMKESQMLEAKVVDTVCKVLDNITGICISQYETAIVSMIAKALQKGENSNNYYIRVSAKDYPIVVEHKAELMECVREDALMDILPDSDMLPNQCLIETDGNVIDASLDEQLNNLKTNLRLLAGIPI